MTDARDEGRMVGCERDDGFLIIHLESEYCEVCTPASGRNRLVGWLATEIHEAIHGYLDEDEAPSEDCWKAAEAAANVFDALTTPQESTEPRRQYLPEGDLDKLVRARHEAETEVERLRDQLKVERERVADLEGSLAEWKADLLALEPEVERLRSALEKIANVDVSDGEAFDPPAIARAALNTETDG